MREAPWSAVAATTAFLPPPLAPLRYEPKAEGGSCCYRTPRPASPAIGTVPISTTALLEMAGEAEELVGARVDFVLRSSLEKSPNPFARNHILSTSVCVYGS